MPSIALASDGVADDDILDPAQATHAASKFVLEGERVRTAAGGIVARAKSPRGERLLVHTAIPSRGEQSIDQGAVVSALLFGALPLASVVLAFKRADKLADLHAAVVAAMPVPGKK